MSLTKSLGFMLFALIILESVTVNITGKSILFIYFFHDGVFFKKYNSLLNLLESSQCFMFSWTFLMLSMFQVSIIIVHCSHHFHIENTPRLTSLSDIENQNLSPSAVGGCGCFDILFGSTYAALKKIGALFVSFIRISLASIVGIIMIVLGCIYDIGLLSLFIAYYLASCLFWVFWVKLCSRPNMLRFFCIIIDCGLMIPLIPMTFLYFLCKGSQWIFNILLG